MSLAQLLLVLRARWRVIAGVFFAATLFALAGSLVFPKRYTASASVVVDVRSADPVVGSLMPAELNPGYMPTQVDIVNSVRVARLAVSLAHLENVAEFRDAWRAGGHASGTFEQWLAPRLQKKLDVKPVRDSNVIDISFTGNDPKIASDVANAFALAYMQISLALRTEPAREYASWFDGRTRQLRENLEKAQQALSSEEHAKGIVTTDQQIDYETTKLGEISSQLTQMQALRSEMISRQRQAATGSENTQEVLQSALISNIKTDLARAESRLTEMQGRLGVNHPEYLKAQAEAASLRSRIAQESRRIATSLGGAVESSEQRESDLKAALEAQKTRVLQMKADRDAVNVLKRDVDSAQRAYDLVGQRLAQARLESQTQQTNIAVLTPAEPPLEASSPKVVLNTLIGAAAGFLLALGAALFAEVGWRHVRSADDLIEMLGMPVLAVVHNASLQR